MDIKEIYSQLKTDKTGLSSADAEKRLEQYGYNEIPEKKVRPIIRFLKNFWGPIPWMIEIAAILSIIINHWDDFAIITAMLLINSVVRFWEENKADNAIALLKEKLALRAKVRRDGKWDEIEARLLVPGDIVHLRLGDIIPADVKLIDGEYLTVDESVLTGESLPVDKKVSDLGYEGAIIRQGEMDGIVVGTALNTFFGKTTQLVQQAKTKSHFQKAIVKIGNYLIIIAVILVVIVFIVGIIRDLEYSGHQSIFGLLQFALVLMVAAIPVALPAVMMVSMAVGATKLAKKKAIVSKLLSIEEAASVDVLCSDKTGTLTKNQISIAKIIPFGNYSEKDVILYGSLASKEESRDPIDDAFFDKAKEETEINASLSEYNPISFIPFDPVKKRTEAKLKNNSGDEIRVSKGALQVILDLVKKDQALEDKVDMQGKEFASHGFRALGIAKSENQGLWEYVGIVALHDPPREDSLETIKTAKSLGINVKMVTGDHIEIAKQIAGNLGIGTNIVVSSDIIGKEDEKTINLVENADGFAEVYPEHKYHIVELLQKKDHVVGMTGDGVNDAPALKKADIGFAVSNATDAAKSAADIVLTDPGISVIVKATTTSRKIFERMKSYAVYRIAETVRILIFLVLSITIFAFYPITAIMIVILALLNDLPIMTIAFDKTRIAEKPVRWRMQRILILSSVLGIAGVIFSFSIFLIGKFVFLLGLSTLQTFIFLKLAVAGHMTIYLTRTDKDHFWKRPLPSKILFITCESTQVIATIFAATGIFMAPIGWALTGFIWVFALAAFVGNDFLKVATIKWLDRRDARKKELEIIK
ncbi:MAG: plasma-membrane proton-efflux P-type ATPase [Candidatus Lokiarchaeota archaeon]|nr:plasma-membrane proton-efflux P-type ATPase [Candidatus Lokiarchaeota archaeon]